MLIVDDHPEFRRRARQLLDAEGYRVVGVAEDGAAGVAAAAELEPDLVLLDVHLPDTLGFELVEELAHEESSLQVILTSTHDEDDYRSRAAACGAAGFITKGELRGATIERLLS